MKYNPTGAGPGKDQARVISAGPQPLFPGVAGMTDLFVPNTPTLGRPGPQTLALWHHNLISHPLTHMAGSKHCILSWQNGGCGLCPLTCIFMYPSAIHSLMFWTELPRGWAQATGHFVQPCPIQYLYAECLFGQRNNIYHA